MQWALIVTWEDSPWWLDLFKYLPDVIVEFYVSIFIVNRHLKSD